MLTKTKPTPWYSAFGDAYAGDQPAFYDREKLPWVKTIEDNYEVIRDEFYAILAEDAKSLKPYPSSLSFPPRKWKTMGLIFWKVIFHKNAKRCPQTIKILKKIPNVISFSLSILEAETTIKPHRGDTDAIIRCHVGLVVPATLPECGFKVEDEERSWEVGKALPFCDARKHTAWNNCKERRLVLIIDVVRPEYASQENRICSRVLASQLLQFLKVRYPSLKDKSLFFRKNLYRLLNVMVRVSLPIQRRLNLN